LRIKEQETRLILHEHDDDDDDDLSTLYFTTSWDRLLIFGAQYCGHRLRYRKVGIYVSEV